MNEILIRILLLLGFVIGMTPAMAMESSGDISQKTKSKIPPKKTKPSEPLQEDEKREFKKFKFDEESNLSESSSQEKNIDNPKKTKASELPQGDEERPHKKTKYNDKVNFSEPSSLDTEITPLKKVSETANIVRPGDWVILNIHETLLKSGRPLKKKGIPDKKDDILLNLDPQIPVLLKNWQQSYPSTEGKKQIRVILITSHLDENNKVREHLTQLGYPPDIEIIFSPDDISTGMRLSTKGDTLAAIIAQEPLATKPNRIIMVDTDLENLESVRDALTQFNYSPNDRKIGPKVIKKNLFLFLKETGYKIYGNDSFPTILNDLTFIEHKAGGSGGVNVLQSPITGEKFTFKCLLDPKQMKEEILSDALYRSLDIAAPDFAVYDHVPENLQAFGKGPGPYRLAEFIEKDMTASSDKIIYQMRKNFVADAFLANWDIVIGDYKNVVMDKGGRLWRSDNGGALRYSALGYEKKGTPGWDPYRVNDLESMRNPVSNKAGSITYADLSDEDLKHQAQEILNRSDDLFKTLDEVTQAIQLDNPSEIKEMLRRRLDDLVSRFNLMSRNRKTSPLSLDEEKRQLAENVVKYSGVIGQLKARVGQESDDFEEKIKSMTGYLPEDQAQKIRNDLLKVPYTQTEAYLSTVMDNDLQALKGDSKEKITTFFKKYAQFKDKIDTRDQHYMNVLISALDAEKAPENREKAVFYHGTDPLTCFLWDIFSAYRSHLKNLDKNELTALRGIEEHFDSVLDVEQFIQIYENASISSKGPGEIDNYINAIINGSSVNYADLGLSVNPFLFGNDGNPTSCTYYLFYKVASVQATKQEALFNAFMNALGIPAEFQDYKDIFDQFYVQNNRPNSKLFQIFIAPQVLDSVAYMAVSGGSVLTINMDNQPYHGFAKILPEMRLSPEKINKLILDRATGKINKERTLNNLQGRLFLKPEIFHNPKFVTIKSYWRHEIPQETEESYLKKLNTQVSKDLSLWLQEHTEIRKNTLIEGTPALKKLYQQVYTGVTGLKYTEQEGKSLLPLAITRGDLDMIKKIFDKYPDINPNEEFPNTLYRRKFATKNISVLDIIPTDSPQSYEIIQFLIDKKLDLHSKTSDGQSLLFLAAKLGNIEFAEQLYLSAPDLFEKPFIRDNHGYSPLTYAVMNNKKDISNYLIQKVPTLKEGLFKLNKQGNNLLHIAIFTNNKNAVDLLVEIAPEHVKGPLAKDKNGRTPLFISLINNRKEICKLLIQKFPELREELLKVGKQGESLLHQIIEAKIIEANKKNIVELLIELAPELLIEPLVKKNNKTTPLHLAAKSGNKDLVEFLIQIAPQLLEEPLARGYQGQTPLHDAVDSGNKELVEFLLQKAPQLLTKPLVWNDYKDTPLHFTAKWGNEEMLELLIEKAPHLLGKPLVKDHRGDTPLHLAAQSGREKNVELFLQKAPQLLNDDLLKNNEGETPLHLATSKEIFKLLIEMAPQLLEKPIVKNNRGNTPFHLAAAYKNKEVIEFLVQEVPQLLNNDLLKNNDGNTPLHWGARNAHKEIVELLIEKLPQLLNNDLLKNKQGDTPLHLAAIFGEKEIIELLVQEVPQLLENNLLKNNNGDTPLHYAARFGKKEAVEFFLKKAPWLLDKQNMKNKNGNTPFHIAAGAPFHELTTNGYKEIIEVLVKYAPWLQLEKNNLGDTPLDMAKKNKDQNIINLLTEKETLDLF